MSVLHLPSGPTNHPHSPTIRSQELQPQHFSGERHFKTLNYSGSVEVKVLQQENMRKKLTNHQ